MSWLAICDRCGFRYRSDELRKEWTGLRVCSYDFEAEEPLDPLLGSCDSYDPNDWKVAAGSPTLGAGEGGVDIGLGQAA